MEVVFPVFLLAPKSDCGGADTAVDCSSGSPRAALGESMMEGLVGVGGGGLVGGDRVSVVVVVGGSGRFLVAIGFMDRPSKGRERMGTSSSSSDSGRRGGVLCILD